MKFTEKPLHVPFHIHVHVYGYDSRLHLFKGLYKLNVTW